MTQESNLGFKVLAKAAEQPQAKAMRSATAELSYAQLHARIVRYALQMKVRGINRRSCVVLHAPQTAEATSLILALALLGAKWLAFAKTIPMGALHVTDIVTTEDFISDAPCKVHLVGPHWLDFPPGYSREQTLNFSGYSSDENIAFYSRSSGTTGTPKYMGFTYRMMENSMGSRFLGEYAGVYSAFPALARMGFRPNIGALLSGKTVVLDGADMASLAARGTERIFASPAQVDRLIARAPSARKIPLLCVAGSIIRPGMVRRWLRDFDQVDLWYGATEVGHCGRVSFTEIGDDTPIAYALDDEVQIEIVDEAGALLPPDTNGIVRIKTPWITAGYVGAPDATADAFQNGWFYPGDFGSVSKDRKVRLNGRIKDQFNFGGLKANAADVDAAACKAQSITGAISFARGREDGPDQLCMLATLADGKAEAEAAAEIRQMCTKLHGRDLVPVSIYFASELPFNEMGKPMRDRASEIALATTAY